MVTLNCGRTNIMENDDALQLLLPTDKRNPSLSLYRHEGDKSIHVYYGCELLDKVPENRNHPQYKLLVANLYNAGLKVASLEEAFGFDRKTMRGWGEALRSGDAERLQRALAGREGRRKLSPAIVGFVRFRFAEVYPRHRSSYNARLRAEVWQVFKVKLSGETLRPLLGELRRSYRAGRPEPATARASEPDSAPELAAASPTPVVGPFDAPETTALTGLGAPETAPTGAPTPAPTGELGCESEGPSGSNALPARKLIADFIPWMPGQTHWSDHLGVLLFWNALIQVMAVVKPPEPLLQQWLASVLLGCHNVEQTKYLNWDDLSVLLGRVTRFPRPQRDELERLANTATLPALWRWNVGQTEAGGGGDFYLDPHTKHYTGMRPLLKGWCACIRWADKALHSDYLHTVKGEPVYLECADNFADLRERCWGVVSRARQVLGWPPEKVLTLIVDRGIFGLEVFEKILADPCLHLVTWEKGYVRGSWNEQAKNGEFTLERKRNRAEDVRVYRFEYMDRPWTKDPRMRQLIVRATNPAGETIEVSVLSDDRERAATQLIALIFNRWLQENDFKYLDKHFGIDQITSYRTVAYAKLAGQIDDRQIQSGQAKALRQTGAQLKREQGRLLVEQEQADYQQGQRRAQIAQAQARLADPATVESTRLALAKTLDRLRQASQRYEEKRTQRRSQIDALNRQREENERQKQTVQKEESRLEQMIALGMQRLDTAKKQLMDALKVSARNLFYCALQPFKKAYDNYRDDHDYFRKLTRSGGVLRWTGREFQAHLLPQVNYAPALRRIIQAWLEQLNATQPVMPDGSQRPLRFFLSDRDDFEIRLKTPTGSQDQPDSTSRN